VDVERRKHGKLLSEQTSIGSMDPAFVFAANSDRAVPSRTIPSTFHSMKREMKMEEPTYWITAATNAWWSRRMGNSLIQIIRANAVPSREHYVV
jgi:hypothetical protein